MIDAKDLTLFLLWLESRGIRLCDEVTDPEMVQNWQGCSLTREQLIAAFLRDAENHE